MTKYEFSIRGEKAAQVEPEPTKIEFWLEQANQTSDGPAVLLVGRSIDSHTSYNLIMIKQNGEFVLCDGGKGLGFPCNEKSWHVLVKAGSKFLNED